MSAAERENSEPGPEALAYGQALRKIFLRLGRSQNDVARLLSVHPSQLSRFFSGKDKTVASRAHADALVRLVRKSGRELEDREVAELHELRRKAQQASPRQDDRIAALQEQVDGLRALVGTFQGQRDQDIEATNKRMHEVELYNDRLLDRVDLLLAQVLKEEDRADHEREMCGEERTRRIDAEDRASQAEWGADEAARLLRKAQAERDEAREHTAHAQWEAEEASTELAKAKSQLTAAARYTRDSETMIDQQRTELERLRHEVVSLRRQVRLLSEKKTASGASDHVADSATQVSGIQQLRRETDNVSVRASANRGDSQAPGPSPSTVRPEMSAAPPAAGQGTAPRRQDPETGVRPPSPAPPSDPGSPSRTPLPSGDSTRSGRRAAPRQTSAGQIPQQNHGGRAARQIDKETQRRTETQRIKEAQRARLKRRYDQLQRGKRLQGSALLYAASVLSCSLMLAMDEVQLRERGLTLTHIAFSLFTAVVYMATAGRALSRKPAFDTARTVSILSLLIAIVISVTTNVPFPLVRYFYE
ncbi:hypothetical protein IHE56_21850 [Streptomyces sp. ID01-12c]|uniref:helix-turn-helix domain-containing protein n=1 Tax=Streptomyces caniscabiei TaxID=2746961 RepID=UPI00177F263B|nr:helix-turn-helix transcriptional regulator [Streptomyces caniscabiei]MBD9704662.1 hypothetical protein [Streptomyces caniscabiei]MDX3733749.1 hypothetical protein [Streptomyces caniscabiei]